MPASIARAERFRLDGKDSNNVPYSDAHQGLAGRISQLGNAECLKHSEGQCVKHEKDAHEDIAVEESLIHRPCQQGRHKAVDEDKPHHDRERGDQAEVEIDPFGQEASPDAGFVLGCQVNSGVLPLRRLAKDINVR